MRHAIAFLMLLALTSAASAGGNPGVTAYIDFDPPNRVHRIQPEPGATIHAYVCLSDLDMGLTTVSFRLTDVVAEYPDVFSAWSFQSLLPGGIAVGDPFTGIILAATECVTGAVVVAGVLHLEYLGGEGCIELLEHPEYPRWVTDCMQPNGQVDYYVASGHGTVGGESTWCPPGAFDIDVRCEPQGAENPSHPPTYWYDCHPSYYQLAPYFLVQVYDSDTTNYTNWVQPPGFVHAFEHHSGELWVAWRDTAWYPGPTRSAMRFQFDNPNPAVWCSWQFGGVTAEDFTSRPDGYGYRVHAPAAPSASEEHTWGAIKALYR